MHKPCGGGVHGDDFLIRSKITHKLSQKKPQSVEACRKESYLPNHNFGRRNRSGEVMERIKETVSKTCERKEQTRIKKTTKKKEAGGDSEQLKPRSAI